jgi:UDP-N-acetylglucosamine 2-epimerase (non-hydrolysing)
MVVAGTRPEIIKMAPIIRELQKKGIPLKLVYSGQHYDYNMGLQFIEELELPLPDYTINLKENSPGVKTAQIMIHIDKLLEKNPFSVVLVAGDTNTVLATSLAANKRGKPIGHVEAGLRSFDLRMPEEHNRRLTDHISEYLFAPTEEAQINLKSEKVWGKIHVTGNTVMDSVLQHLPIAEKKSKILESIAFSEFALATAHRAENVDDFHVLKNLLEAFAEAPLPIIYPMHPRTQKMLRKNNLFSKIKKLDNLMILPPLSYLDFLVLMKASKLIITDSGGIQEEATAPEIRKHVIVTRLSTERPEAVEAGFVKVVGTEKRDILDAIQATINNCTELPRKSPFGEGDAAEKIIAVIQSNFFSEEQL